MSRKNRLASHKYRLIARLKDLESLVVAALITTPSIEGLLVPNSHTDVALLR